MSGRPLRDMLASQAEPSGTLGDLLARVARRRRRHRHRRLVLAARSVPREPSTVPMNAVAAVAPGRAAALAVAAGVVDPAIPAAAALHWCEGGCHRYVADPFRFCCWVCMTARDGGWPLQPWNDRAHWTAVHTRPCEERHLTRNPAAFIQAIAWRADSQRAAMDPSNSHRCPARKCPRWVPNHLLMCGQHWRLVPRELQRAVYRAYDGGPEAALDLIRAQSAAIASVNDHHPA